MANKTIPQLPEQTGKTDNDLLAIVDSGETTTSKIKVSTLLSGIGGGNLLPSDGTDSYRTPQYLTTDTAGDYQLLMGATGSTITNTQSHSSIVGSRGSTITAGGDGMIIVGGWQNSLSHTGGNARSGAMIGGYANNVTGIRNLTGGIFNTNSSDLGVVLGGQSNTLTGNKSFIGGGQSNTIGGNNVYNIGGNNNSVGASDGGIIGAAFSSINNGNDNGTNIFGGFSNVMNNNGGLGTFIVGGYQNQIRNFDGTTNADQRWVLGGIIGGRDNTISGDTTSVNGAHAVPIILGGVENDISGSTGNGTFYSSIISSSGSTIVNSTLSSHINSDGSTISGGDNIVMIGCSGRTGTNNNTTYVETLEAFTHVVLNDYSNLNFADDAAAALGNVPLGGIYHNAGDLRVRIT